MKKTRSVLLILLLFTISHTSHVIGIEQLVPFQATMTDSNSKPLANGLYDIQFYIYDTPTGGTSNWDENHTQVSVINGQINLILGHITAFPSDFDFNTNRYLGISVNNQNEMNPRYQLNPAFHAYSSSKAASAGNALEALTAISSTTAATANYAPTASSAQAGDTASQADHVDFATNASQLNGLPASNYALNVALEELVNRVADVRKRYVPAGSVSIFAAETPPAGYLECNGQELLKADYPDLFTVIGGRYGETENTFFLPDYRGYFHRGWNHNNTDDPSIAPDAANRLISSNIGSNGVLGDQVGTKQASTVLAHTHTFTTGNQSNDHTHSESGVTGHVSLSEWGSGGANSGPKESISPPHALTGWNDTNHTHSGTTDPEAPETRPINITVMYIIKY